MALAGTKLGRAEDIRQHARSHAHTLLCMTQQVEASRLLEGRFNGHNVDHGGTVTNLHLPKQLASLLFSEEGLLSLSGVRTVATINPVCAQGKVAQEHPGHTSATTTSSSHKAREHDLILPATGLIWARN